MNALELQIMENINNLSTNNLKKILNFVKFIKMQNTIKESEREDELSFMLAQEESLSNTWDNDEDEAWNDI